MNEQSIKWKKDNYAITTEISVVTSFINFEIFWVKLGFPFFKTHTVCSCLMLTDILTAPWISEQMLIVSMGYTVNTNMIHLMMNHTVTFHKNLFGFVQCIMTPSWCVLVWAVYPLSKFPTNSSSISSLLLMQTFPCGNKLILGFWLLRWSWKRGDNECIFINLVLGTV